MLDLNQLLLILAFLSPAVVLVRTARRGPEMLTWRLAALAVVLVTTLGWLIARPYAGYVGGGAWVILLMVPAFGLRKAAEWTLEERYGRAAWILGLIHPLHPAPNLRDEQLLLRGLNLAQDGQEEAALEMLGGVARAKTPAARRAIAQCFRIRGDWSALLEWCRASVPRVGLGDSMLLLLYLRALGELGSRNELVLQFAGRSPALQASVVHHKTFLTALMTVMAFCGRTVATARVLRRGLHRLPCETAEFWMGTSELAAGEFEAGRARFKRLATAAKNHLIKRESAARLQAAGGSEVTRLEPPNESSVTRFEREIAAPRSAIFAPAFGGMTPAVAVIALVNVGMFLAELALGGAGNVVALDRLGALEPRAVVAGQYWRLLAALFLHAGFMHLSVNLFALYVLGTALEHTIGALRFAAVYLLSGLGASAGVVALWRIGATNAELLVGASGAVMGVLGAWIAILLAHRHLPDARRRLLIMLVILVVQIAFDLYTPQVSIAAHLCGLVSGVIVGFALAPPRRRS